LAIRGGEKEGDPNRERIHLQVAKDTSSKVLLRVVRVAYQNLYARVSMAIETSPGVYEPVLGLPGETTLDDVAAPAEEQRAAVLVTADSVWVGVTSGDKTEVKDLSALPAALQKIKASAPFADRTDLEIGADESVPYSRVVQVIDAAVTAGFSEPALYPPASLSVKFTQ
jgi:biopolymer transport protein ExbD